MLHRIGRPSLTGKTSKTRFIPTIIIVEDPFEVVRGYSLKGREFILREPKPVFSQSKTLDEVIVDDHHWVIDIQEYLRVVPEAAREYGSAKEVLIPVFVAKPSFRPEYVK